MKALVLRIALRLALCAGVIYPAWRMFGIVGFVVGAPLLGVALAGPIYELIAGYFHMTRWLALHDVQGHYFAYKGMRVRVFEDAAHFRWVSVADVNKIVRKTMTDRALEQAFPTAYRRIGFPPATYLHCEALGAYLSRATASRTLRFLHWAEREIASPARKLRARKFGVPNEDHASHAMDTTGVEPPPFPSQLQQETK